jgi:pimeloyl-ACP methyl ester carboxylesterase
MTGNNGNGLNDYLTNSTIAASERSAADGFTNADSSTGALKDVSGVATTANIATAGAAANGTLVGVTTNADYDFVLPGAVFANVTSDNPLVFLHFEGCQRGEGYLSPVILYYNGTGYTQLDSSAGVALQLKDMKELYERWTVGDGPSSGELSTWLTGEGGGGVPNSTANISSDRLGGVTGANFTDDSPDGTPYILMVHGWNTQPWEKDAWAETAYKRLYWQGYQGRFGTFQWPTTYHTLAIAAIQDYDLGEFSAWLSAKPLENLLTDTLASRYGSDNIYLFAHSMGNVVAGEALRLAASDGGGQIVNSYVASQAAVPAHAYDPSQTIPGDYWGWRIIYSAINILGIDWINIPVKASASTPNIYPNWFEPVTASGSSIVNFYNTNDYALNLAHWQTNEALKPDGWVYPVGYGTTGTNPFGYSSGNYSVVADDFYNSGGNNSLHLAAVSGNFAVGNTTYGSNLNDQYQIMAFAAQAQCAPLGDSNVGNVTSDQSLQSLWPATDPLGGTGTSFYAEHPWHSAEFRFDNMMQNQYWKKLLQAFSLLPPD